MAVFLVHVLPSSNLCILLYRCYHDDWCVSGLWRWRRALFIEWSSGRSFFREAFHCNIDLLCLLLLFRSRPNHRCSRLAIRVYLFMRLFLLLTSGAHQPKAEGSRSPLKDSRVLQAVRVRILELVRGSTICLNSSSFCGKTYSRDRLADVSVLVLLCWQLEWLLPARFADLTVPYL